MKPDCPALAARIAAALAAPQQMSPPSRDPGGLTLQEGYEVADLVRARLGGRRVGLKAGFTNRNIWPVYGVDCPIWGVVSAESLRPAGAPVALAPFAEPRIEPEIVLGLHAAPEPGMDRAALAGCVGWVAPGFEIVQSIYPGWSFGVADTVAAQGLHGCLVLGERIPATPGLLAGLAAVTLTLRRGNETVETGTGANALGGPLEVLAHLVTLLDEAHALRAGELISTGTLTDAWPVAPGEAWSAEFGGEMACTLPVRFA